MAARETSAVFPSASRRAGMYESFYLRAVAPDRPLGVWIRNTVHKRPGSDARGSVWCTVFDAERAGPFMHKLTSELIAVPEGGWISVKDAGASPSEHAGEGARMSSQHASGRCGGAEWSLRWSSSEPELRHLGAALVYSAPLPRTKLTSPSPRASFDGTLALPGIEPIVIRQWPGMVGHNWGSEHAERWIWLHAVGFAEAPDAWLDVALGRVRLGRALTPWIANGAFSIGGRRYRIGGFGARGLRVRDSAAGCALELPGERGLTLAARARVPDATAAGWRYTDPDGSAHDVVNCSIAAVELDVRLGRAGAARTLLSDHGGAYELGMRERDHGVPIAPFADG